MPSTRPDHGGRATGAATFENAGLARWAGPAPFFTPATPLMPEDSTPAPGLMGALAPIVARRPVHITASDAGDGRLHVIVQPVRLDGETDAEIARGFAVTASPEALDDELPTLLATRWVPAHAGLQQVIDQVARAATEARDGTLRKAARGGKARGAPAEQGNQTLLLPPAPDSGSDDAPAPTEAGAAAENDAGGPMEAPAEMAPAAEPPREASRSRGQTGAKSEPAAAAPALQLVPSSPPSDSVSALFD